MRNSALYWLSVLVAFAALAAAERKNWALLIAGSRGYGNYRHQADVCHAYQILHKNGIPDEQIVVMMNDDIANSPNNPYPGNIINKPGGPNVYLGVPKDYTGETVNADVALAVLQGDKKRVKELTGKVGKVIESGPEDYVFVNFADHGGDFILGMPHPPFLKAKPLNDAIIKMHEQKKFAKLVFYLEACESGSIFEHYLPKNISVFATTASNPDESSWGCYCHNDRNTCLGDLYSVSWMEDSDTEDLHTETLQQQYEIVKKRTNLSHVMEYGDQSFSSLPVDQFLGNGKSTKIAWESRPTISASQGKIPTDMVGIHTLESLLASEHPVHVARRAIYRRDLRAQYWIKTQTAKIFTSIAQQFYNSIQVPWVLSAHSDLRDWDCFDHTTDRLFELCPRIAPHLNDFVLRKMNVLVNLCNKQAESKILSAIESVVVSNELCY